MQHDYDQFEVVNDEDEIQNRDLIRIAVFGKQVEEFLVSDIGRYLCNKAESDIQNALDKIKTVNPENTEHIRGLQNDIWKAESFKDWLGDAVLKGLQALQIIEDNEHGKQ